MKSRKNRRIQKEIEIFEVFFSFWLPQKSSVSENAPCYTDVCHPSVSVSQENQSVIRAQKNIQKIHVYTQLNLVFKVVQYLGKHSKIRKTYGGLKN